MLRGAGRGCWDSVHDEMLEKENEASSHVPVLVRGLGTGLSGMVTSSEACLCGLPFFIGRGGGTDSEPGLVP